MHGRVSLMQVSLLFSVYKRTYIEMLENAEKATGAQRGKMNESVDKGQKYWNHVLVSIVCLFVLRFNVPVKNLSVMSSPLPGYLPVLVVNVG